MGVYPSYHYPQAEERYSALAQAIGAAEASPEGLIQEILKLMKAVELPTTFRDAGVDKDKYMGALDDMAEAAFDDQCTPCNPR